MINIFPEGSYFNTLFNEKPNIIIEIRSNGVAVYDLDLNETGFSRFKAENLVQQDLKDLAKLITELM